MFDCEFSQGKFMRDRQQGTHRGKQISREEIIRLSRVAIELLNQKIVANPGNMKNPPLSVMAVIITLDPMAGPRPSFCMTRGMIKLIVEFLSQFSEVLLVNQGIDQCVAVLVLVGIGRRASLKSRANAKDCDPAAQGISASLMRDRMMSVLRSMPGASRCRS